ncbi:MAG: sulfatase-like hydrolase/transferase [Thermoanaerobaculia bacterium]
MSNGPERPSVWHLFTLYQFAIAQPIFHLLGRHADFFVAHRAGAWDPFALAAFVYLVPAGLLLGAGNLVGRLPQRFHRSLHEALIVLLGAVFLLPAARKLPLPAFAILLVALAGGTGIAWATRRAFVSRILEWGAPVSLVFPVVFLFFSPVRGLAREGTDVEPDRLTDSERPPVILLVLDELPLSSILTADDEIDASRFPALAELASGSVWFRNATTVSDVTNEAVPAILTGEYPERNRIATAAEYPRNLFTLLGTAERTHAIELLTRLCPGSICGAEETRRTGPRRLRAELRDTGIAWLHVTLPRALTGRLPSIAGTWRDFGRGPEAMSQSQPPDPEDPRFVTKRRDRSVSDFETFLADLVRDPAPGSLHFLHLELPHIPWRFLPSGLEYGPISKSAFAHGVDAQGVWTGSPWQVVQGLQRHLLQAIFTDTLIARLTRTLKANGLWESALVIVTADHGLAFQRGEPGRTPTRANALEIMAVPLFVRAPGLETGTVDDRNAELVDLLPTVIDFVGGRPAGPVDGRSLLGTETGRPTKRLIVGDETWSLASDTRPARLAAAARIEAAFGRGTGIEGIYRVESIAPARELVGEPLPRATTAASCRVLFEEPWSFDRVGWTRGFLPAQVTGRILGCETGASEPLAIAINGVIAATTWTYVEGDATRFTAMVPPAAFQDGANTVDAFRIREPESAEPRLELFENGSRIRYRIEQGEEELRLVASNGTTAAIETGAVTGEITREGQLFSGWAEDPSGTRPFVAILVFVDGELVHSMPSGGFPVVGRNAASVLNPEGAGVRFMIPSALMPNQESEVRVFAVKGPVGSELAIVRPAEGR